MICSCSDQHAAYRGADATAATAAVQQDGLSYEPCVLVCAVQWHFYLPKLKPIYQSIFQTAWWHFIGYAY